MSWGDWMMVHWTLEEELQLEAQSRSAFAHNNSDEVRSLCASLIKQNAYYAKLLEQATGHIAELEMTAFLGHHQPQPTHGILATLADSTAGYAKFLRNCGLRLMRRTIAVITRHNIFVTFI